jgi:hypothetical protein
MTGWKPFNTGRIREEQVDNVQMLMPSQFIPYKKERVNERLALFVNVVS